MQLVLRKDVKHWFSDKQALFEQIMALDGEVYRAVKNRQTLRFVRDGKGYFIKKHFGVQLRLSTVSAKHEWQAIQKLEQLGIPTMTAVGFGERGFNPLTRQSFIITEEIQDTIGLRDICISWQQRLLGFNVKKALIQEVAYIAKILHKNGVNHRDFYMAHFLWNRVLPPKLYVIDLHRAQIRNHVPERWVVKDLAGLYFSAQGTQLTQRDVFRFLQCYFEEHWYDVVRNHAFLLRKIVKKAKGLHEDDPMSVIKKRSWWRFIRCRKECFTQEIQNVLHDPDKFIANGVLLSAGDTCTVARIKVAGKDLVIKRYNTKNFWHFINRLVRHSRAARCWTNAQRLLSYKYKIKTPEPIAMIENRFGPLRSRAYFITEYIEGKTVLDYFPTVKDVEKLQPLAQQLINIFAKLYKQHIRHGDTKGNNFIIVNDNIYLVDLDGMRKYFPFKYKIKQAFAKDKARFMKNWRDYPAISQLFKQLYSDME